MMNGMAGPRAGPNNLLNFNELLDDEIRAAGGAGSHGGLNILQSALLPDFHPQKPDHEGPADGATGSLPS
ncbi:MAG: hypothetical protein ACJAVZ_000439 [Afipia broomeae]|jgi:hypothetical protein